MKQSISIQYFRIRLNEELEKQIVYKVNQVVNAQGTFLASCSGKKLSCWRHLRTRFIAKNFPATYYFYNFANIRPPPSHM